MADSILDGTGYFSGDVGLALLITLASFLTYSRVAFDESKMRMPIARLCMAFGFTVWGLRFWWTLSRGGDVIVAPISMLAIGMVLAGYCWVQLYAIRRAILAEKHPVWCIQNPAFHCEREDRVQEAWTLRDKT